MLDGEHSTANEDSTADAANALPPTAENSDASTPKESDTEESSNDLEPEGSDSPTHGTAVEAETDSSSSGAGGASEANVPAAGGASATVPAADSGAGGAPNTASTVGATWAMICDPNAAYGDPLADVVPVAGVTLEAPVLDAGVPPIGGGFGGGSPLGNQIADGQVWLASKGAFLFSRIDQPGQIWQLAADSLEPTLFLESGGGKGMTLDSQGRLVIADSEALRITRLDPSAPSAALEVLVDMGPSGLVPNDVVVRDDGNMYVSDNQSGLYHVNTAGVVTAVEGASVSANGVALSLDQTTLYVSATGDQTVTRFALRADGTVDASTAALVFNTLEGNANGMTLDCAGNFYVATNGGVEVFTKAGETITSIDVGTRGVNVAFGGADHRTLFIASQGNFFTLRTGVPGFPN